MIIEATIICLVAAVISLKVGVPVTIAVLESLFGDGPGLNFDPGRYRPFYFFSKVRREAVLNLKKEELDAPSRSFALLARIRLNR